MSLSRTFVLDPEVMYFSVGPSMDLYVSTTWGSDIKNSRESLGQFIERKNSKCFSISHTPGLGGVFLSTSFCGLDVERTDRVSEKVARRICSMKEWEKFSSTQQRPSYLWCAKESAWKSLKGRNQPATISDVSLNWSAASISNSNFSFPTVAFKIESIKSQPETPLVEGVVFEQGAFTVSLAW